MMSMWADALVILAGLIALEVSYRIVNLIWFKTNNLAGEIDCEEE